MKVSIDREELVRLREFMQGATLYSPDWKTAMTLLNAMIGKGEEDHSICTGCLVDGICGSQIRVGRDKIHGCTMRVPATPPSPQVTMAKGTGLLDEGHGAFVDVGGSALGPRGHTDPGDENLVVDGRLPPQYVTRQEMEVAIEKMRDRILGSVGLPIGERLREHEFRFHRVEVDVEAIAKAAVDAALKMREEKRHGMKPLSALVCEDCAHVDVCAMRNNQNPQNCGHVLRTTPQS